MPLIDYKYELIEQQDSNEMSEIELVVYSIIVGDKDPSQILYRPRGSAEKFVSLMLQKTLDEMDLDLNEENLDTFKEILRRNFFFLRRKHEDRVSF